MKFVSPVVLVVSLLLSVGISKAEEEARIIGGVSDGAPSPPSTKPPLPKYKIHWGHVQQKKDHKVFINQVEPPAEPAEPPVKQLTAAQILKRDKATQLQLANQKPSGGTFFVFATTYDGHATRVRWNSNGEEFVVWSNVDWKYLCGFTGFEGRGERFNLLLLHGNESLKEAMTRDGIALPPKLPSLEKVGARYAIAKGGEDNEEAMEFIEAIHDLYAAEQRRLKAAYHERQKNWKIQQAKNEELRLNPPPKPDVTINYWKRHTPAKPNQKNR